MHTALPFFVSRRSLALALIIAVAACSSSSDSAFAPGSAEGSFSDAGAGGKMTDRSDAGTAPNPGMPSSQSEDARRPPPKPDAGDDASTCASLDSSKAATLYLSSDDSNSMASPVIARSLLRRGTPVPPSLIRTYEFLNYYNVAYAPPAPGTLGVTLEARPSSDPAEVELHIGVQSAPAASPRRGMNIVLVLDTSGSMAGNPIDLERAAVRVLASQLRAGDVISAVTWNTAQQVAMNKHIASGPNDSAVLALADNINADGGTDLDGGLQKGYELAQQAFDPARINRVVVVSDGQANVGVTNEQLIGDKAEDQDKEAIYLVGIGVGDGVNDTLMNVVTDAGRGAYVYLDSKDEAERMLGARFDEVMDVAARGVQVELKMPWFFQMQQFFGEEYSTDPVKVKPQHLAPGDAMVFEQLIRACDASKMVSTDPVEVTARWTDPFDYSAKSVSTTKTFAELAAATDSHLARARAIVAYAEALKLTDMSKAPAAFDKAVALADSGDPTKVDPQLNEIRDLATAAKSLLVP